MNKPVCVYIPTRMKHIDIRIVPMQLKNKILSMNKLFSLAVMLIATAFLSFLPRNGSAQCDGIAKSTNLIPVIGQTKATTDVPAEVELYGFQQKKGTSFPYYFEFTNESGEVISAGSVSKSFAPGNGKIINGSIQVKIGQKVYFVACDSSSPKKKLVQKIEIGVLQ